MFQVDWWSARTLRSTKRRNNWAKERSTEKYQVITREFLALKFFWKQLYSSPNLWRTISLAQRWSQIPAHSPTTPAVPLLDTSATAHRPVPGSINPITGEITPYEEDVKPDVTQLKAAAAASMGESEYSLTIASEAIPCWSTVFLYRFLHFPKHGVTRFKYEWYNNSKIQTTWSLWRRRRKTIIQ